MSAAYHADAVAFVARSIERAARRPVRIGINGPQGAGKSTLAGTLVEALSTRGLRGLAISIDDFYLTNADQRALAAAHPGNRYLEHRGYPGTHDVALGTATLGALAALGAGEVARVPVYDKSAHGGRGDRAPESDFVRVAGPLDYLLLEGWMLGFSPVAPDSLSDPDLGAPNELLAAYAPWTAELDVFIRLVPTSLDHVVAWRMDSERARRASGQVALSEEEARDYIERFLPAYRTYLPDLDARTPAPAALVITLAADRSALALRTEP